MRMIESMYRAVKPRCVCPRLLLAISMAFAGVANAQLTDVVYLNNGDRMTGSVSVMNLGEMIFETGAMGFVNIKWEDVKGIETDKTIQFETARGERYFGRVAMGDEGYVAIVTAKGEQQLAMERIITFSRIKADRSVWEAMDKDLRVGFSFTKGSDIMRWNIGAGLLYKALKYRTSLRFNSMVTNDAQGKDTRRAYITGRYFRLLRNRYFWTISASGQTDDELGIDKRLLISGTGGRFVWQRQQSEFMIALGLAANRESSTGDETNESEQDTSLEGVLEVNWTFFKLHSPSSKINTRLQYYPGITESGRHRANLELNFRQEFVKDMFWVTEFWSSYDSHPPSGAISGEDYGITTSLEYIW